MSKLHGLSYTKFHKKYRGLKERTTNKNSGKYPIYGGRGIKSHWTSFMEFKEDMYESYLEHCKQYGEKNTQLDRINVNGNYSKENCRWATMREQAVNKRNIKSYTFNGKSQNLQAWAREFGINIKTLYSRIYQSKMSFEDALTTAPLKTPRFVQKNNQL